MLRPGACQFSRLLTERVHTITGGADFRERSAPSAQAPYLRRMSPLRTALALPLLLLAGGCGDDTEKNSPEAQSNEPTRLVVTKSDGGELVFEDVTATCGPSENDPDTEVVRLQSGKPGDAYLDAEIAPGDVEGGRTYELPVSAGDQENGFENLYVFVGAAPDVESSSTEEESSGTLEVLRASCDPLEVELTVDGTLGSEYFDGEPVDVKGRLVFPAPAG